MTDYTRKLTEDEVEERIGELKGWSIKDDKIVKDFKFNDFDTAMDFVNGVAKIARAEDHHPDITISYNKVSLSLTNHKLGGLSEKDFEVGKRIDEL